MGCLATWAVSGRMWKNYVGCWPGQKYPGRREKSPIWSLCPTNKRFVHAQICRLYELELRGRKRVIVIEWWYDGEDNVYSYLSGIDTVTVKTLWWYQFHRKHYIAMIRSSLINLAFIHIDAFFEDKRVIINFAYIILKTNTPRCKLPSVVRLNNCSPIIRHLINVYVGCGKQLREVSIFTILHPKPS